MERRTDWSQKEEPTYNKKSRAITIKLRGTQT